jgi:site-specific DNA recombinase
MKAVTAAIYTRISHDPEGLQAGVDRQEQDCRQMAADRGWLVLEPVYRENDVSASTRSKKRRPVYEQLLQDVGAGGIEVLLAYSTSRLTRRPMEYEALIELTARTGLTVETVVSGSVQLGTADGRAIARVLAVIDAAEAERVSERVIRSTLQRAEQGPLARGPHTPFGYQYAPSLTGKGLDLVIDDDRAKLVREACRRVVRGHSLTAISKDWNARGLVTTTGAPWRPTGIRKMLVRPSSAGLTERRGRLYPGTWPAILRRKDWDAARAILLDPRRDTRTFRQIAKRYPLAGLLVCGRCGHFLVSNPLRGVPSFICNSATAAAARSVSRATTSSGICWSASKTGT